MLWQHGKKELQKFLEILNSYHPTIKLTANYSREKISFLDVEVVMKRNQLVADLYVKPTVPTNIFMLVPVTFFIYSKALRLNRICSENSFFDKLCNDLEIWLKGRGYSNKLVWKQILKGNFQEPNYSTIKERKENERK